MIGMLAFASGAAVVTCGDLPTGGLSALTVEGWFRIAAISSGNRPLVMKYGASGHEWAVYVTKDGRVYFVVYDASGVNAGYSELGAVARGTLTHVAGCYDGSHVKTWVSGADVTFASRLSGGVVADTAQAAQIGGYIQDGAIGFVGRAGWVRVSDVCRYPGPLTGPDVPPAVDEHTLGQWHMSDGSGATVDNAEGTAAYDGAISGAEWVSAVTSAKVRARPVQVAWFGRSLARPAAVGQARF